MLSPPTVQQPLAGASRYLFTRVPHVPPGLILVLGSIGAGKSTHARRIASATGAWHVSLQQSVRTAVSSTMSLSPTAVLPDIEVEVLVSVLSAIVSDSRIRASGLLLEWDLHQPNIAAPALTHPSLLRVGWSAALVFSVSTPSAQLARAAHSYPEEAGTGVGSGACL